MTRAAPLRAPRLSSRFAPPFRAATWALVALVAGAGCAGGPPRHRVEPSATPPRPPAPVEAPAPAKDDDRAVPERLVRIGVHWDETRAVIETLRSWTIEVDGAAPSRKDGGVLRARAQGENVRLETAAGSFVAQSSAPIRIAPAEGSFVSVDERRYRGSLELLARNDSLFVVEVVPLEEYLRGVVPAEIGRLPNEARDAVAAQAIAARTYTMRKLGQYRSLPFDLFASVQDQVYEGFDGEDPVADAAVRETAGLVLAAGDGLVDAYYSAACGGERSDVAVVWPHKPVVSYLRGGPDGEPGREWCRASRHFEWREEWTGTRLSELVRRHLAGQGTIEGSPVRGAITDLRVRMDAASGRVREIEYRWNGGSARVPGDKNRWILRRPDGSILRSVFVELSVERQGGAVVRLTARGRGNGHGVGMCQTGAIARARAGEEFAQILDAYYPGGRIRYWEEEDLRPVDRP